MNYQTTIYNKRINIGNLMHWTVFKGDFDKTKN